MPSGALSFFFFLTENFTVKNYVNFVSFGILFLKQQVCFAFRDKRQHPCPQAPIWMAQNHNVLHLVFIFHDTTRVTLIFLIHRGIHSISKDGKDTSF